MFKNILVSTVKQTKAFTLNFGPVHPAAHGAFRLISILTNGKVIVSADPHVGSFRRGTEKLMEYKTYLQSFSFFVILLQFSGPLACFIWGYYWYCEQLMLILVAAIGLYLLTTLYYVTCLSFGYSFLFLLGLVVKDVDAALFRLYYGGVFIYAILFTLSLCTRIYVDLAHSGILIKLLEFLPTANCLPPEAHERFFIDLSNLVIAKGQILFNGDLEDEAHSLAKYLKPIIDKAVADLLIRCNGVTPAVESDLRAILSDHLMTLARNCYDWSLSVDYTPLDGANVSEKQQQINIYKAICIKTYIHFFFNNPDPFPDFNTALCASDNCTRYAKFDYLQIVNFFFQKSNYAPLPKDNESVYIQSLVISTFSLNELANIEVINLLTQPAIRFVEDVLPVRSGALSYRAFNIYKPQLVVVSSGGAEGLTVVSPAEAGVIKVGTPEYEERLVKSWDNIAAITDDLSYWGRFQKWLYTNPVSDKEYINSLRTTTDPKIQKTLLAGLKVPPVNPATDFLSYLHPQKYHFVDGVPLPKGKPVKVDFIYVGEEYGVPKKGSLDFRATKLYSAIDSELAIAKAQNINYLVASKRL